MEKGNCSCMALSMSGDLNHHWTQTVGHISVVLLILSLRQLLYSNMEPDLFFKVWVFCRYANAANVQLCFLYMLITRLGVSMVTVTFVFSSINLFSGCCNKVDSYRCYGYANMANAACYKLFPEITETDLSLTLSSHIMRLIVW